MPNPQDLIAESGLGSWVSDFFSNNFLTIVLTVLGAILVFFIGRWLARYLARLAGQWFTRSNIDETTSGYLAKLVYILLLISVVIVALSVLGVPMASFVAVLGASVLAIGLALQDSLSNLASGLLLIVLKPYVVTDVVEVGNGRVAGKVEAVDFFHTALRTVDNSLLLVPNREVMDNPILNFTEMQWRRVDLEFGISYDDDLRVAKQLLMEVALADSRVLTEPPIRVAVKELADNAVILILQPYVHPSDYLATKYDLTEQVKLRFDEAGLTFPFSPAYGVCRSGESPGWAG